MLSIQFNDEATFTHEEIVVEEPYARVGRFIASDVQRTIFGTDRLLALLRGVIDGSQKPLVNETGNAWTMDIDATSARLTNFFNGPHDVVEVPTAWLVDALERWRAHLVARGHTS